MQQQTSILGPVQLRRVLTKLIDQKSTTSAPLALSGSHISVPSPPATSQSGDPMDHLEDFTQPKKAEEFIWFCLWIFFFKIIILDAKSLNDSFAHKLRGS